MALWKPDPTFYPSPRMAMQGAPESLAYVATFNPNQDGRPDAMTVLDLAPDSPSYGQLVGRVEMSQPAMNCITSVGTGAARRFAPTRRIRTWSGVIW